MAQLSRDIQRQRRASLRYAPSGEVTGYLIQPRICDGGSNEAGENISQLGPQRGLTLRFRPVR